MSGVAKAAGKAIYASEKFLPKGSLTGGATGRFNLLREIAIGMTLGVGAGMLWKVGRMRKEYSVEEIALSVPDGPHRRRASCGVVAARNEEGPPSRRASIGLVEEA